MTRHRIRTVTGAIALLAGVVLVAAGAANARPHQVAASGLDIVRPGSPNAVCGASAGLRAKPVRRSPARASSPYTYDDYIEDVATAPDICQMNLVTNDNLAITIGLHIHDRPDFSVDDAYSIYFDTDSNAGTGAGTESGAPAGTEYAIDIAKDASSLRRWSGSSFEPVTPQAPIITEWLDGYGPVLQIGRTDLGDTQAFSLVFVTTNGVDRDLAPDAGMWSYKLSPLALTPGRIAVGSARAGKPLVARMEVERSDFGIALWEGKITCTARVGGKALAGRGSFARELVGCTWRVPTNARGKRLGGTVMVTFQGVTAKRSFSVRVR